MQTTRNTRRCCVENCTNSFGTNDKNIHMFRFPQNEQLKHKWFNAISQANGKFTHTNGYVCSEHFSSENILIGNKGESKLVPNCIPTEFWVDCIEYEDDVAESDSENSLNNNTNAKNTESNSAMLKQKLDFEMQQLKLTEEIKRLKIVNEQQSNEISDLKNAMNTEGEKRKKLETELSEAKASSDYIQDSKMRQLIHCLLNGVGHKQKYPEVVRDFCLAIHYLSVRAYGTIRTYFKDHLPHPRTIRAWYANSDLNCQPGISDTCLAILKRRAERMRAAGRELVVSVIFDEMYIRKMFQWCHDSRTMYGYPTYGSEFCEADEGEELAATQAIVFMVAGINERIQLPIAYHYIKSLVAEQRRDLVTKIIDSLIAINVKVASIGFDGLSSNRKMCRLLGANLNILSPNFQPYFFASNGDKIRIIFDICHMQKIVRGVIGTLGTIYDENGEKIEWKFYERLLKYSKKGLGLTHKLTNEHIFWQNQKMNVKLAVQLLSRSTANTIEYLMNKGYTDFHGAQPTIAFTRLFNDLFDIFNSKFEQHRNPLKRALCRQNRNETFQMFHSTIEKLKEYKIIKDGHVKRLATLSVGFKGIIINMYSLMQIYEEYVEEKGLLTSIPTYHLSQDPVEILFGKIRSFGAANTNPTCQQFQSAYRKLLVYSTVCTSKKANVYNYEIVSQPFSTIKYVTSRRAPFSQSINEDDEPVPEQLEEVLEKLVEIERQAACSLIDRQMMDISIAYSAKMIENRIDRPERMYCDICADVFNREQKLHGTLSNPCISTYNICKEVDRFLKVEMLRGDINFQTLYYTLIQQIDIENSFTATDFTHQPDHKLYLIRAVVDAYIQIKGTFIARNETSALHRNKYRQRLNRLIHFYGQ